MGAPGPGLRLPLRRELRGGRPGADSGAVQETETERNGVTIRQEWQIRAGSEWNDFLMLIRLT